MRYSHLFIYFVLFISISCSKNKKEQDINAKVYTIRDKAKMEYDEGDYVEAHKLYDSLIMLEGPTGIYFYRRGVSLTQLKRDKEAIADFERSAELGIKEFDSYYNLGIIYMLIQPDRSRAIGYFEKCLEINPESQEVKDILEDLKAEDEVLM